MADNDGPLYHPHIRTEHQFSAMGRVQWIFYVHDEMHDTCGQFDVLLWIPSRQVLAHNELRVLNGDKFQEQGLLISTCYFLQGKGFGIDIRIG